MIHMFCGNQAKCEIESKRVRIRIKGVHTKKLHDNAR